MSARSLPLRCAPGCLEAPNCTQLPHGQPWPAPRALHSAVIAKEVMWMFGGRSFDGLSGGRAWLQPGETLEADPQHQWPVMAKRTMGPCRSARCSRAHGGTQWVVWQRISRRPLDVQLSGGSAVHAALLSFACQEREPWIVNLLKANTLFQKSMVGHTGRAERTAFFNRPVSTSR